VRRFTLITIISLFLLIAVAAAFQIRAALNGPRRFPGPGSTSRPSATLP
jgi:hypothetical protein